MNAPAAEQRLAELEAQAVAREAEIARLHAGIARLHAETEALSAALAQMHASVSWRLSAPVRGLGRLGRNLILRQPRLTRAVQGLRARLRPAPSALIAPAPAPADANAGYIFRPVPLLDDGAGIVRLNTLYHLSRSL